MGFLTPRNTPYGTQTPPAEPDNSRGCSRAKKKGSNRVGYWLSHPPNHAMKKKKNRRNKREREDEYAEILSLKGATARKKGIREKRPE